MSLLNGIRRLQTVLISKTIPLKLRQCFYMNLSKDVTVYVRENAQSVRLLSVCALSQWVVLTFNSYIFSQHLPAFFSWIPKEQSDDKIESKRIPQAKWTFRYASALFLFSTSTAIVAAAFIHSFRCVHSITLLKSSDKVVFKTYTPFGTLLETASTIPNVSALQLRNTAQRHVPIKVKGQYFNFIADLSGNFKHPTLFDRTVGASRNFGVIQTK